MKTKQKYEATTGYNRTNIGKNRVELRLNGCKIKTAVWLGVQGL